jgi:uncharacterized protein (TIGR02246 family)
VRALLLAWALLMTTVARAEGQADVSALAAQVRAAEQAFSKAMADRDAEAFASRIADDAVFFGAKPLRGKNAIVSAWKQFFAGPQAPFSWQPEEVEVLDSGTLALSSGPVRAPDGKQIGVFNSIWRHDADGVWRVVFDKGCPDCPCKPTQ